jgi:nucleoside-diphosphate-sugar epimerase
MNIKNKKTLFITGAAGYVGELLCDQFSKRDDVEQIIALDKEGTIPNLIKDNKKIIWISANTFDKSKWLPIVEKYKPSVVIHTAWQIREMYGERDKEWKWNVDGTKNIFDFAFSNEYVEQLIHYSTASLYGAQKTNTCEHAFKESEPMNENEYIYAIEKIQAERDLLEFYADAKKHKTHAPIVSIVRPAAITGPAGRFAKIRFGLQSALAGQLEGNFFYRIISLMVSFIPASKMWVRQFIHEDDVYNIMELFIFDEKIKHEYEVFNITPPGEPVFKEQMAEITGKKILPIQPWMARIAFFFFWHVSRGVVPNGPGVWRFYCYPIVMDGTKITEMYGYTYTYSSRDAFKYTDGRYSDCVPESKQRTKK